MSIEYWDFIEKVFIALFVTIDPLAIVPVFLSYTSNDGKVLRRKMALKGTLIAGCVLVVFALLGDSFLKFIGISQAAFQIAGGFLLCFVGMDMIFAKHSGVRCTTEEEAEEAFQKHDISVFPLAIPLLAGPGALTTLVISMREAQGALEYQVSVFVILLAVLLISYVCLRCSNIIYKGLGVTGTNVLTRIFGIIIVALAVEYILSGLSLTFPGLVSGIAIAS